MDHCVPTLATGGKCIVTSTPNSDDDTFAQIWHQAVKTVDEYGNTSDVGVNGFKGYLAKWDPTPRQRPKNGKMKNKAE